MCNTKNYTEQNGEVTHIGGKLIIETGAEVVGLPKAKYQPESDATTIAELKKDFNALLANLTTAGIMADGE